MILDDHMLKKGSLVQVFISVTFRRRRLGHVMLVDNFDTELEEYIQRDGFKSDREPQDNLRQFDVGAMTSDQHLKIRWRDD